VAVKNGIVTLSGLVDSCSKKITAEKTTKKVAGVKAIAEDIQIDVSPIFNTTDTEIAEAVLNALKWHSSVQEEKIEIKVENGSVRLDGEVEWEYQKTSAASSIINLAGVRSVVNLITVKPKVEVSDVKHKINRLRFCFIQRGWLPRLTLWKKLCFYYYCQNGKRM
jgi:osmotically-inducible protein OsmY